VPTPRPQGRDGVSLVPLLRGRSIRPRPLFWHYPHYGNQQSAPSGAVREGRWKLVEWFEDQRLELFDVEKDPGERRNVAREHRAVTERMQKLLATWRGEVGARMPSPNPRWPGR
jgi:arylsulfatase A-like enzyme